MGVRRCAWCGRVIGVRWWLRRGEETTGICRRCLRREYASYPELAQPEDSGDHSEAVFVYLAAEVVGASLGAICYQWLCRWQGWPWHWALHGVATVIGALLGAVAMVAWMYGRNR